MAFWVDQLPLSEYGARNDRIDACLSFFKKKRLSDGSSALLIFLTAVESQIPEGDQAKSQLHQFIDEMNRTLEGDQDVRLRPRPHDNLSSPFEKLEESTLLDNLASDRIEYVLDELSSLSLPMDFQNELLQLRARMTRLLILENQETQNPEVLTIVRNKIRMALSHFVTRLVKERII